MRFWNTHWPVRINLQESMAIIRTTCVTIHFKSIWMTCPDQADSIRLVDLSKRWLSWKMNPKIDEQIERVIFWNSALYYVNWINESHLAFECIQCRCDLACCWPINVDEFGEQIVYLERKKNVNWETSRTEAIDFITIYQSCPRAHSVLEVLTKVPSYLAPWKSWNAHRYSICPCRHPQ